MIKILKFIFITLCICFISLNECEAVNTDWSKIKLEENERIVVGVEIALNNYTENLNGIFLKIDDNSIKIQSTDFDTADRVPVSIIMAASEIEQKGKIVKFRFNKEDVDFIILPGGRYVYKK